MPSVKSKPTDEDPKEFLRQYRKVNSAIDRKLDEISDLRCKLNSMSQDPSSEHVVSSPKQDKFTDIIFKIDEKEHEADKLVDQLCDTDAKIQRAICHVKSRQARELLKLMYISGCSFEIIAVKMGITHTWAIELHGRGLRDVGNFIKSA